MEHSSDLEVNGVLFAVGGATPVCKDNSLRNAALSIGFVAAVGLGAMGLWARQLSNAPRDPNKPVVGQVHGYVSFGYEGTAHVFSASTPKDDFLYLEGFQGAKCLGSLGRPAASNVSVQQVDQYHTYPSRDGDKHVYQVLFDNRLALAVQNEDKTWNVVGFLTDPPAKSPKPQADVVL
jgi:hypothetical protein